MNLEKSLRRIVSTLYLIATHARNIHWNVEGSHFFGMHYLTEKIYKKTDDFVDDASEKMLQNKFLPPASLAEFLSNTDLVDLPSQKWVLGTGCKQLLSDIDVLFKELVAIDGKVDTFTQPLIDEISTFFDKYRWQLNSVTKTVAK